MRNEEKRFLPDYDPIAGGHQTINPFTTFFVI